MFKVAELEDGPPPAYNFTASSYSSTKMDGAADIHPQAHQQGAQLLPQLYPPQPDLDTFVQDLLHDEPHIKKQLWVEYQNRTYQKQSHGLAAAVWLGSIIYFFVIIVCSGRNNDGKYSPTAIKIAWQLFASCIMVGLNNYLTGLVDTWALNAYPSTGWSQFYATLKNSILIVLSWATSVAISLARS
ncbi:hypothetical protein LTR54_009869 [Friedmanniomyces endolithicus]|nr:hypothetical protein LTR54_009869 [Friedmanniomyces endolithicus]